jgi:hypothetical protein
MGMPSGTNATAVRTAGRLSGWPSLNVAGLVLAATGMLLQMAAGSTLYPSVAGPVVLGLTAVAVFLRPGRWTAWAGLVVPLVLGVGAIAAAAMTGVFVGQLTSPANPGILIGSVAHVAGLGAAVLGGSAMVAARRPGGARGR